MTNATLIPKLALAHEVPETTAAKYLETFEFVTALDPEMFVSRFQLALEDVGIEMSALQAGRLQYDILAMKKAATHAEADKKGQLWTLAAAAFPSNGSFPGAGTRAFVLVLQGDHEGCANDETFTSQHPNAIMFGETKVLGSKSEAMAKAASFINVDEVTVRVILK